MSKDLSSKYFENNEERLPKKQPHERYQSLSEEEKQKKQQYGCE